MVFGPGSFSSNQPRRNQFLLQKTLAVVSSGRTLDFSRMNKNEKEYLGSSTGWDRLHEISVRLGSREHQMGPSNQWWPWWIKPEMQPQTLEKDHVGKSSKIAIAYIEILKDWLCMYLHVHKIDIFNNHVSKFDHHQEDGGLKIAVFKLNENNETNYIQLPDIVTWLIPKLWSWWHLTGWHGDKLACGMARKLSHKNMKR